MAAQKDIWFRPKRYGYGAEPTNWKGWLATGLFVALVAAIAWLGMVRPALEGEDVAGVTAVLWWAALIAMTVAFIWLCWAKTDGEWRWRWGQRD